MRLYLSSYRIGDRAGSLLALLGDRKRAAIIENARDNISPAARELYRTEAYDPLVELASLGIAGAPLDLRNHFGDPEGLRARLSQFDLVWVTGGNAFVLRRAMKQSGFDDLIVEMLDNDQIVYGGFSAGAVVAAPSLEGIHLMDDPDEAPDSYHRDTVWDGLGLIDHAIVPHYRSAHPESASAERAVRHLSSRGLRYRALRDGEVIVWTEDRRASADPMRRIA
ncbi:MAG: Peptidase [Devosia sp.]|uniref:Type 1 glutamine amidotransferase-like domain-containing protein n=1 Tax=Devosia sp. TaxID=1871048 RepID=UPI00260465CE|nr:Type 1 glutamine amidotransferase-like domain-containing protein [Devosia sp.]MDB5539040.1 Peptidase [Devosia sp.]